MNLHTSAGLGNAIGNLTNARVVGTPLVVTAGQQDERHIAADPLLSGDLVGHRPTGHEVGPRAAQRGRARRVYLHRAFHDAASPPAGPVFLSLPMNLLEEEFHGPLPEPTSIELASVAPCLDELAALLAEVPVGALAIVVGDEINSGHPDGVDAVVELAEALGAPGVRIAPPLDRRLPRGPSAMARAATDGRGAGPRPRCNPSGGSSCSAANRSWRIRTRLPIRCPRAPTSCTCHPIRPGWVGTTRPAAALRGPGRDGGRAASRSSRGRIDRDAVADALAERTRRSAGEAEAVAEQGARPLRRRRRWTRWLPPTPCSRSCPTTRSSSTKPSRRGSMSTGSIRHMGPGRYFRCRGGGLGWGMPAAVGAALGAAGPPAVCIVGDGSALYSPQALWTAAHLDLPVVFVVVNNRQYLILKRNLQAMSRTSASSGRFVAMDIDRPPVDYLALAASFGVPAMSVTHADEVGDAVRDAIAKGGPRLIEVPISS